MKKIQIFIICLLAAIPMPVLASPGTKAVTDSLFAVSVRHALHGRFDESNAVLLNMIEESRILSRKDRKAVYGQLAINAELAGDYEACCRYLRLKDGRKTEEYKHVKMLSLLPRQVIERPDRDVSVGYMIDSLYYEGKFAGCEIRLPVTIDGEEENLILDNGCAKYCVASESFADEHHIRPIGSSGKAVGVVETVSMWFGIADSFSVGEMTFRNILFVVIPDKFIDNAVLEINAMLGASFFRLAGEMVFDNRTKTIVFPSEVYEEESNVTIYADGKHYVDAVIAGDTLSLQLDLGAARTALSANYYRDYEEKVKSLWTEGVSHVGGVGGLVEEKVYSLPELEVASCGGVFIRRDAKVSVEQKPSDDNEYGNLGNDFLLSFNKCRLNLAAMYLYVE